MTFASAAVEAIHLTCDAYGADGTRLKKIEAGAAANCPAAPAKGAGVTAYFANVEIRTFGAGATAEQIITYPVPSLRLLNGVASVLHRDQLGSVRGVTKAADGLRSERATYRPFGERHDADAGLQ